MTVFRKFSVLAILAAGALFLSGSLAAISGDDPAPTDPNDGTTEQTYETAIFAGGCFWCIEADFEKFQGVLEAIAGYSGGFVDNPSYRDVTFKNTGHYEVVLVKYDPSITNYRSLVDYFLRHIDPFDPDGQFCDRGPSYRTAIFAATADERLAALDAKSAADALLGKPTVTPVLDRQTFWRAEEYHQDYYKKNRIKYSIYRNNCGRDQRVKAVWGDK